MNITHLKKTGLVGSEPREMMGYRLTHDPDHPFKVRLLCTNKKPRAQKARNYGPFELSLYAEE